MSSNQASTSGSFNVAPSGPPASPTSFTSQAVNNANLADLADILRNFRCPRDCHLYGEDYPGLISCPFGHVFEGVIGEVDLKKVPPIACISALLGDCKKAIKKQKLVDIKDSGQEKFLTVERCQEGVHFKVEQLVDLEHFYEQFVFLKSDEDAKKDVGTSQTSQVPLPAASPTTECAICMNELTAGAPLGQLSNCIHIFCASCLLDWFKAEPRARNGRHQTCPTCRSKSAFLLTWPMVLKSRQEKEVIFHLQHDSLHSISSRLVSLDEDNFLDDEDDEEEDDDDDDFDEDDIDEDDEDVYSTNNENTPYEAILWFDLKNLLLSYSKLPNSSNAQSFEATIFQMSFIFLHLFLLGAYFTTF